jgi:hypothetical protein
MTCACRFCGFLFTAPVLPPDLPAAIRDAMEINTILSMAWTHLLARHGESVGLIGNLAVATATLLSQVAVEPSDTVEFNRRTAILRIGLVKQFEVIGWSESQKMIVLDSPAGAAAQPDADSNIDIQ